MDTTIQTTATATLNGKTYTFTDPHDVIPLVQQINDINDQIALYTKRLADSNTRLADLQAQLAAYCV